MIFGFSRGSTIHDNRPQQCTAQSFAAFCEMLERTRAPKKDGAPYFCGRFNGDGRRCAEGVLPTRFLVIDLDKIDPAVHADVRMWFARFSAVGWPTHSSRPDAPRERVIIELSREVTRDENIAIGDVLACDLADEFGEAVKVDPATFRPEQPVFVPPTNVVLARFDGEPLDVEAYLAAAQKAHAAAPERRTSGVRTEDVLDNIRAGESLHDALMRLTAKWAQGGMDRGAIRAAAAGFLEHARAARGDRVDELAGAELDRLIDGALKKYAPAPSELPREIDLRALAGVDPPAPVLIVRDWLPQGEVTLFAGHGGSGKSAIALYLAVCIALGREWYGIPTLRRRVVFVSLEDPRDVLHWRLARICAWLGVSIADLGGWLMLYDGAHADAALMSETRDGAVLTHVYEWLHERMDGSQVLMLDGASDAYSANENARAQVRAFVRAVRRLIPPDGAVVLLAHVDKLAARTTATSEGYSGSTAWSNSVRARWYLRPEDDDDGLVLEVQKANHSPTGSQLRLRWNPEAHMFVGEISVPSSKLDRDLAEADERETILRLIREADAAGDPIPAATGGTRQAWHALSARPGFPQTLNRKRTHEHIEVLRQAGAVRVGSQPYGKRNNREVLRAA